MPRLKFVQHNLVIRTNQLVPYKAKLTVCYAIHKEHVNKLCEQNV